MVYRPAPIHHIRSASEDVPSGHSRESFMESTALGIVSAVRHSWLSWWVDSKMFSKIFRKHWIFSKISSGHVMMSCTLWTVLHTDTHLTFCATQLSLFKVAYVPRGRKLTSTQGRGQWIKQLKQRSKIIWKGMHVSFSKPSDVLVSCCFLFWDSETYPTQHAEINHLWNCCPLSLATYKLRTENGSFRKNNLMNEKILPKIFHVKNKQVRVNSITVAIGYISFTNLLCLCLVKAFCSRFVRRFPWICHTSPIMKHAWRIAFLDLEMIWSEVQVWQQKAV